jgi:hypothetical protein
MDREVSIAFLPSLYTYCPACELGQLLNSGGQVVRLGLAITAS